MKQAIVGVLTGLQSLDHDETRERPIDRLMAVGNALRESHLISLGRDAVAYKYALQERYRIPAISKLTVCLGWPQYGLKNLRATQRQSIAWWGLTEWAHDACSVCKGKTEIPMAAPDHEGAVPMMPCHKCGGAGKKRWEDSEREKALPDLNRAHMDKALAICSGMLHTAESLLVRETKRMLERW